MYYNLSDIDMQCPCLMSQITDDKLRIFSNHQGYNHNLINSVITTIKSSYLYLYSLHIVKCNIISSLQWIACKICVLLKENWVSTFFNKIWNLKITFHLYLNSIWCSIGIGIYFWLIPNSNILDGIGNMTHSIKCVLSDIFLSYLFDIKSYCF